MVMRVLMILLMLYGVDAICAPVGSAKENRKSSAYWKEFVIAEEKNDDVAMAHRIFRRLLQTWGDTRVPPFLYVVESGKGPWAAALYDGAVIINRAAIETCLTIGGDAGEDYIAFVLAHELVHHRSDDIWKKRVGLVNDPLSDPDSMYQTNKNEVALKQRRADAEGIALMSLVGYDPNVVVANTNFFKLWVEKLGDESCDSDNGSAAFKESCSKAKERWENSQTYFKQLANQTLLFELGVQAYVASDYVKARHYFTAMGRFLPSHSVHNNIGLSLLGEARVLIQQLQNAGVGCNPDFIYPLLLSTTPVKGSLLGGNEVMRSGLNAQEIAKLKKELKETLDKAIKAFSRALEIDPQNRHTFVHLASAYLMSCNTPMAKGVLLGEYVPEFGTDGAVRTLLAMATALEGNENEARLALTQLLETDTDKSNSGPIDPDLLIYTATNALTALLRKAGEHAAADEQWRVLALRAKENGQSALFQQSLAELASWQLPKISSLETPDVKVSLGDYVSLSNPHAKHHKFVSFDGKWLTWNRENNVRTVMDEDRQVIAVWKENNSMRPLPSDGFSGEMESRLNTKYGVPDRRITTERGIYMAYDHIGVAFHLIENRVSGWFYY